MSTKHPLDANQIADTLCAIVNSNRSLLQGDENFDDDESELDAVYDRFIEPVIELVCKHQGHELHPDMCDKVDHDFCVRCNARRDHLNGDKVKTDWRYSEEALAPKPQGRV